MPNATGWTKFRNSQIPTSARSTTCRRAKNKKSPASKSASGMQPRCCYNANPMSTLFDELEKQSRLLSLEERARLAHILIEELDSSIDSDVEVLWIAEAQRRYRAYKNGEIESLPGDEVMSRARSRLK